MTMVASDGDLIRIHGITPNCQYVVTEQGKGWLIEPAPEPPPGPQKRKLSREEIRAAIENTKIEWQGTRQELYAETREP